MSSPGFVRKLISLPPSFPALPAGLVELSLQSWERYELMDFVGEGGMGRVYKAFDPVLKRPVALKFLRREDPELQRRLIHEAQAQARIRHPHVCEIYEVSEFQNHAYIAMQYIDGKNLLEVREALTQEQKAKIVCEVAGALHAAHRLGLIHRDVKPANILVETKEDGTHHPYILDFGLVRELEVPRHTVTGVVVGTPCYMSPEQARGEADCMDRRSDVYSLGATLYELLCGYSPFDGSTGVDVILKLLQEEPLLLRKRNPAISEDLESIAMKCLEKEPERRYDSARALSEDLQRFLDAEPVLARRAGLGYRIQKKIKKNRGIFAVSVASFLLISFFALLGFRARWNATLQTRLAQQFGQEIERMDSTMRYAYLLPIHDIRMEKQIVKERMRSIERQMKQMGRVAKGPGEYALGRGWMSLHEYEKARDHLEQAWRENYRAPEVAYALGHTLGILYHTELEQVERISSSELREFRKKQIEKEFRDRAFQYMNESAGVWAESPAYVRAKIAFYQKRYEEALRQTHQAWTQIPWLYEAKLLEGEIWKSMGNELRDRGDSLRALDYYEKSNVAYQEASAKAASDNSIYEARCGLIVDRMNLQMYQTGKSIQDDFERGLEVCGNGIKTNPESEIAYDNLSMLHFRWGEYQMTHGGDPRLAWNQAQAFADQELRWNPRSANAYNNKGRIFRLLSEYEMERGVDPIPHLNAAIENFQNSIKINPRNLVSYHNMGNAYWTLGEYQVGRGIDPRKALSQAFQNFEQVLQISPDFAVAYHNLGLCYWTRADYEKEHGEDPIPSLLKAGQHLRKSLELTPDYALAHMNLGGVLQNIGEFEATLGLDPAKRLHQAIASFEKALAINPDYSYAYNNLVEVYRSLALNELRQGKDASRWFNSGKENVRKAVETNPDYYEPHLFSSRLDLVQARTRIAADRDPEKSLNQAEISLKRALELNLEEPDIYNALAEMHQLRAEWNRLNRKNRQFHIRKGLEAVEKALQHNPGMARALAIKATLEMQQQRPNIARSDLERAFHANANLKREYGYLLDEIEKVLKEKPLNRKDQ